MVVATAMLAVAVLGNAVGAFGLAVYLTQGIIRSLLAGLGLITLAILLRDLLGLGLVVGPLKRLRSIRLHAATVQLRLRSLIAGVGIVFWLWATLAAFGGLEAVVAASGWVLTASVQVGETSITPGTILIFGIAVWIAVCVSRVTRFFLDEDVLPRLSLPRGVPGAISASLHYVLIAVAIVIGTQAAGFDLTKVTIVFGALGVGIGFGLQNIVNNFMSGLILLFERPIQLGDNVQVGALMGIVRKIGIRASIVRTYEGSEVIVPNGDLISQQVVNFTLSDRSRRLEFLVGIAYGSDLEHAREVIAEAVAGIDRVVSTPAPQVLFQGFGESSLDFRILFWVGDFDEGLGTRSQVGLAVERALRDAGFTIPFPQRDVHLKNEA